MSNTDFFFVRLEDISTLLQRLHGAHFLRGLDSSSVEDIATNMRTSDFDELRFGVPVLNVSAPSLDISSWLIPFDSDSENVKVWNSCFIPKASKILRTFTDEMIKHLSISDGRHRFSAICTQYGKMKDFCRSVAVIRITQFDDPSASKRFSFMQSARRPHVRESIYDLLACLSPPREGKNMRNAVRVQLETSKQVQSMCQSMTNHRKKQFLSTISDLHMSLFDNVRNLLDTKRYLLIFTTEMMAIGKLRRFSHFFNETSRNIGFIRTTYQLFTPSDYALREGCQTFAITLITSIAELWGTQDRYERADGIGETTACLLKCLELANKAKGLASSPSIILPKLLPWHCLYILVPVFNAMMSKGNDVYTDNGLYKDLASTLQNEWKRHGNRFKDFTCAIEELPRSFAALQSLRESLILSNAPDRSEPSDRDVLSAGYEPVILKSSTPTHVPTPEPTCAPTPEPTSAPRPDPTPDPTPTPEPSPEPTPDPTPTPLSALILSPSPAHTPDCTPDRTPNPSPEPTPVPTPASTPELQTDTVAPSRVPEVLAVLPPPHADNAVPTPAAVVAPVTPLKDKSKSSDNATKSSVVATGAPQRVAAPSTSFTRPVRASRQPVRYTEHRVPRNTASVKKRKLHCSTSKTPVAAKKQKRFLPSRRVECAIHCLAIATTLVDHTLILSRSEKEDTYYKNLSAPPEASKQNAVLFFGQEQMKEVPAIIDEIAGSFNIRALVLFGFDSLSSAETSLSGGSEFKYSRNIFITNTETWSPMNAAPEHGAIVLEARDYNGPTSAVYRALGEDPEVVLAKQVLSSFNVDIQHVFDIGTGTLAVLKALQSSLEELYYYKDEGSAGPEVIEPQLGVLRDYVAATACVCGGHSFLNAESEKSVNMYDDKSGRDSHSEFTARLTENDAVVVDGLHTHASLEIRKSIGRTDNVSLTDEELCKSSYDSSGRTLHIGLYIHADKLESLLKSGEEEVDIIYPSSCLFDIKSAHRDLDNASSNFELRELFVGGITHRLYCFFFQNASLATSVNEKKHVAAVFFDPQFCLPEYLGELEDKGIEGMQTWLPIIVRLKLGLLRSKRRQWVQCPVCKAVELFANYGNHYVHYA